MYAKVGVSFEEVLAWMDRERGEAMEENWGFWWKEEGWIRVKALQLRVQHSVHEWVCKLWAACEGYFIDTIGGFGSVRWDIFS